MNPNPELPRPPHATAPDAEWRAYLGGLLDLVSKQGVPALRLQGFTDQDLFELRRLATLFRKSMGSGKDLHALRLIADKLEPLE